MKRTTLFAAFAVLSLCAAPFRAEAVDTQSIKFHDRLLAMIRPEAPSLYEDAVIFTAAAGTARRIGVAFAHEGYGQVHWFKKLVKPTTGSENATGELLFQIYEYPTELKVLTYRLVVDGQWTADPWNPNRRLDAGIAVSYIELPPDDPVKKPVDEASGLLRFAFRSESGQTVHVAGSFNAWDPFMYEMVESAPGLYQMSLPLPPGTYRYAFFEAGEQIPDPSNPRRVYTKDGRIASEAVVH